MVKGEVGNGYMEEIEKSLVTLSIGEGIADDERRDVCCFQAFEKSVTAKRFVGVFLFSIVSEKLDSPRANLEFLEIGLLADEIRKPVQVGGLIRVDRKLEWFLFVLKADPKYELG